MTNYNLEILVSPTYLLFIFLTLLFSSNLYSAEECKNLLQGRTCEEVKSSSAQVYNMCCAQSKEEQITEGKMVFSSELTEISKFLKKMDKPDTGENVDTRDSSKKSVLTKEEGKYLLSMFEYMTESMKWNGCKEKSNQMIDCGEEPVKPIGAIKVNDEKESKELGVTEVGPSSLDCKIEKEQDVATCKGSIYKKTSANLTGENSYYPNNSIDDDISNFGRSITSIMWKNEESSGGSVRPQGDDGNREK